ncbi:MAG TPA: hypothetical protein PKC58_10570 [Ignavibacteria bacterium]|nr:hypothetical protein [Ignavibacteria bacterium]
MNKIISFSITVVLFVIINTNQLLPQSQIKIAVYNLLNYPGNDAAARNPYFRTVINSLDADIIVVNEINTQSGVNSFLSNVLNFDSVRYSSGQYINGYDSDNAIFFKTSKINFISNIPVQTNLRDINEFKVINKLYSDTLRIYAVHLKAGVSDSLARGAEIDSLRKVTDQLSAGSNFIVLGDFNIYSANETAYKKLLFSDSLKIGNFYDPLTMPGIWNSFSYAPYHTQSTRTRSFGNGATGGLDDRFDMILNSKAVKESGGIKFLSNTYAAFGNDGNHYNDSINQVPNSAVSQITADALHYASDHLPVMAVYEYGNNTALNIKVIPEGTFNLSSGRLNRQDSVKLNLRNSYSPYSIQDSASAVIDSNNFTAGFNFNNTPAGNYYIELRTANTLETWSNPGIQFVQDTVNYFDFTISSSQAFGNNEILKGGKYCIYSGDVNNDGMISLIDNIIIYNNGVNFYSGYSVSDINGDNVVDLQDVLTAYNNSAEFIMKITP